MKSITTRLRQDAGSFSARVPAATARRIQDALQREKSPIHSRRYRRPAAGPLMAGMAAGLVAAVAGALWLSQHRVEPELQASPVALPGYQDKVTRLSQAMERRVSGEAELQLELERLNADMHRIQARLRDELEPLL